jgi:hypothetical protein
LTKKKIEVEAIELDEERPRGRFNDGHRAWRDEGREGRSREGRDEAGESPAPRRSSYRAPAVARDPFFDKPYEARPQASEPASWEVALKAGVPARGALSANIKPRRKLAALFKAPVAAEPAAQ